MTQALVFEQTASRGGRRAWKVYREGQYDSEPLGRVERFRAGLGFSARGHMPTFTAAELHQIAEFITSQDG